MSLYDGLSPKSTLDEANHHKDEDDQAVHPDKTADDHAGGLERHAFHLPALFTQKASIRTTIMAMMATQPRAARGATSGSRIGEKKWPWIQ